MIKFETERLIIREHNENDLLDLHELISKEKAMFYIQDIQTKTIKESKENLEVAITESNSKKRDKYFLAITKKDTDEYIGEIGVTRLLKSEDGDVLELGYFIKEEFWGRGLVFEAAKPLINYCFTELNTLKIEAGCIKENIASEKIMKKLGMTKEAEFISHSLIGSKLYDRVEYRLLKSEWEKLNY